MSRVFKFWAWHEKHGEMVTADTSYRISDKRSFAALIFDVGFSHFPDADEWEILLSSRKIDPSGHEVCEGDIFQDHFNSKIRGVVKFGEYRNPWMDDLHGGHVGFYIEWIHDEGRNRKDLGYWVKISSVIGNIFKNPELVIS